MRRDSAAASSGPQNDRKFVRQISGAYNLREELERLRAQPRVRKGRELTFSEGPQAFNKTYMEPKDGLAQTLHLHVEEFAPGGRSQKHVHVNEAVFYILDGEGVEEHDGQTYEWEAGDVAIVHNNCVHQHFNRSREKPARALVFKTKPMFIFMNMLFQTTLVPRPPEPAPGAESFRARETSAPKETEDVGHADADAGERT